MLLGQLSRRSSALMAAVAPMGGARALLTGISSSSSSSSSNSSLQTAAARRGNQAVLFAGGKREIHGTRASMGMFDGIKNSWSEATEIKTKEKQDEAFKYQVGYLVKKDKIDLNDLLEMMKEGAEQQGYKGWRKHMPGTSSNPQVQELEKNEKIIMAIPPELRAELGRFKGMEKIKVQKATGCTAQEINKVLKSFKEIDMLHGWLRKRAAAGKVLPSTPNDMMKMMMEPDGGMSKKLSMRR